MTSPHQYFLPVVLHIAPLLTWVEVGGLPN
jgi:hypothetical protein